MKIREHTFDFKKKAYVMGILNITNDSFSDGGDFRNLSAALRHAVHMIESGVHIIDIGGESSRPKMSVKQELHTYGQLPKWDTVKPTIPEDVSVEEELNRVIPIIEAIRKLSSIPISVDTYKSVVAKASLQAGADIINSVHSFDRDPEMKAIIHSSEAPVILMHNRPKGSMHSDIIADIIDFFKVRITEALESGIDKKQLIIDPGFGYHKNWEENQMVLKRLSDLKVFNVPILMGLSRKSSLGALVHTVPKERLGISLAANIKAIENGASIVRVHDVKEHVQATTFLNAYRHSSYGSNSH